MSLTRSHEIFIAAVKALDDIEARQARGEETGQFPEHWFTEEG
ncbi:MAG: hypothetical protein ACYDH9_25950 [Limisphaerales bacterium]